MIKLVCLNMTDRAKNTLQEKDPVIEAPVIQFGKGNFILWKLINKMSDGFVVSGFVAWHVFVF